MRWISGLLVCFFSHVVSAQFAPSAAFYLQVSDQGEVQAVLGYEQTNVCDVVFTGNVSARQGNTIEITSKGIPPLPCSVPLVPSVRRQIVVGLGSLPDATYSLTWAFQFDNNGPSVQWRTSFNPADLRPRNVHMMSRHGLFALCFIVLACAGFAFSRNRLAQRVRAKQA
jgi:hypothetical protein